MPPTPSETIEIPHEPPMTDDTEPGRPGVNDGEVAEAIGPIGATAETARRSGLPARRHVVALAALVALLRYAFVAHVTMFRITPDEFANVGMARFLAGGNWNMLRNATWQPGLATVLAPLYALVHDPDWLVRASLMVNAAVAGVSVLVLVKLVSRLTALSSAATLFVAGAIALSPSSLSASAHVWAEPLVTLTFLSSLWCVLRFYDERSMAYGLGAVGWAVAGYLMHGRLLLLVAIVVGLVVVGAVAARQAMVAALAVIGGIVGVLATDWYSSWVIDQVWEDAYGGRSAVDILSRLQSPLRVLDAAAGQVWYQLCSTALIAGLGTIVLVRRGFGKLTVSRSDAVDARIVLAATLPLVALSVVFMSDRGRPDYLIYGRYNDAILSPVLAVGAAWVFAGRRQESRRTVIWMIAGLVVVTAELGLLLHVMHHRQFAAREPITDMIAGLTPFVAWLAVVNVLTVTVLGIASFIVLAVVVVSVGRRPAWVALAVGVLLMAGGVRSYVSFKASDANGDWSATKAVAQLSDQDLPRDVPIGVLIMPDVLNPDEPAILQNTYSLLFQWFLPDHSFVVDHGVSDDVGPIVLATTNDKVLADGGARIVWRHPAAGVALWREPGWPRPVQIDAGSDTDG